MGLLSPLLFAQQSPWGALTRTEPPAPLSPYAPPVPPQQQRRRRQPAIPFTPQNAEMLPIDPQQGQQPLAAAPGVTNAQVAPMSWGERINGIYNNPLFHMGLSIMGNAQDGGDWAAVSRDMQAFQQQQQQRRLLDNQERRQAAADQREGTTFERQQQMWGLQDQQRQRWEAALGATQDPELRQIIEGLGPEGYGEYLAQQRITPFQQRQLDLEERQLQASREARASQDAWQRRFQGALGAADAGAVAEQGALVRQGVMTVRPILQEMRHIITQYPDIMGSWLNTGDRMQMVRLAGGDQSRLAAMERLNALATQLTLPQLDALRPATNLDFERIRSTIADPQMTLQGALAFLESQDQTLGRALQAAESQGQWIQQYGSLSLPNENGQTWAGSVAGQPFMQFTPTQPPQGGQGGGALSGPRPTPSPEDVRLLRQDSSAARRRQFDEVYGPGAAARALSGDRIRPHDQRRLGGSLR